MLTKEDLQVLSEMFQASEQRMSDRMDKAIVASEQRMCSRMDQAIAASEERMCSRIAASEDRMTTHMNTVIESSIKSDIKKIAEGHLMLAEKMDRMEKRLDKMQDDIDEIKGAVTAHDIIITNRYRPAQ